MPDDKDSKDGTNDTASDSAAPPKAHKRRAVKPEKTGSPTPIVKEKASDRSAEEQVTNEPSGISEQALVGRIKKSDRWMIGLTAAIVLVGVAGAYIAHGQLKAMNDQLGEMRSSSRQTDDTIGALKTQASIMLGQLNAMRAERRPWVTIGGAVKITSPLTFDANGVTIEIVRPLKNGGRSIAENVQTMAGSLMVEPILPAGPYESTEQLRKQMSRGLGPFGCPRDTAETMTSFGGDLILPGDTFPERPRRLLTGREKFFPDKDGRVNVWETICIVYRDDEGIAHGTVLSLQFLDKDGSPNISPKGIVPGSFTIFGIDAY